MTFKDYILGNLAPNQEDKSLNEMITRIMEDTHFPATDNVRAIATYLYKDLDQDHTMAFQKLLMIWSFSGKSSPIDLEAINYIIDLQTNDKNYRYADQIPAHINHRR